MSTRLARHSLQGEGKAYILSGEWRVVPARSGVSGTGGTGFALCSCGWRSAVVNSGNIRRAAHRSHKDAVARGAR